MSRSIPSGLPVVVAVVAVLVIHGAPALAKEKDSGRTFDLGKYGALRMDVPDNWKVKKRRASKNPLEQIEFSSRNDKKFRLILNSVGIKERIPRIHESRECPDCRREEGRRLEPELRRTDPAAHRVRRPGGERLHLCICRRGRQTKGATAVDHGDRDRG